MDRLPSYPFKSRYLDVSGIQIHYIDEGDRNAPAILFLHGVPTWSFTFRNIIPGCLSAGLRAVAPDLPGFGLSEKPVDRTIFTLKWLVEMVKETVGLISIDQPVLFAHDWGGVIGMLIASEEREFFSGMILCNGLLPLPATRSPVLFRIWRSLARYSPILPIGMIVNSGCKRRLTREERSGYEYPFHNFADKGAVRRMPGLLPVGRRGGDQKSIELAWSELGNWRKPLLTLFSDGDPITRGYEKIIHDRIPGAAEQPHRILSGGHFLQEDAPEEISEEIIRFVNVLK